ncbi:MAG: sulfite exporter TauE/SafE family protein [Bacteroidetes bacterium]|nr:sulfite exporter TauE/SafE family protein [Bacteroidota bacterium]
MNTVLLLGGLMLGLAGSFHCIGMCGPLNLALPMHQVQSIVKKNVLIASYQIGRVINYAFLGLLIGLAGRPLQIGRFQQGLSIGMGILIILAALLYNKKSYPLKWPLLARFFTGIQQFISKRLMAAKRVHHFFILGMANAWLPCGLVYIAMASTFSIGKIEDSVGFMAAFGVGTLPSMLLVSFSGHLIKPALRLSLQKMVPYFVAGMGILLILRGLNLGIPYLSPVLPELPSDAVNCHPA